MKIKVCFSLLCLLLASLSFGQVTQEAINKSRDYLNYKLTNYCIEKFVNTSEGEKKKIVYDSIKTNLTIKALTDASDYNTLSAQLSNRFELVKSKLSENINKLDFGDLVNKSPEESAKIIITKAFDVYNTKYGNRFPIIDVNMKSNLEKEISDYLRQVSPPLVPTSTSSTDSIDSYSPSNEADQGIKLPMENNENDFFSLYHLNFWNLLSLLLVIGVLIFCLIQIARIHNRIDKRKKITDDDTSPNKFPQHDSFTKNVNKGDIERFIQNSDKISELNEAIGKLQNRISGLESRSSIPNQHIQNHQAVETYQTNTEEIFYMMKPVDDYFPNSNKSYQKNDTVYKFTVNPNKTEALFEIHTGGAPVNDIAKRNEAYIKPACEEENMPGSLVNNIVTKRKGVASFEGDKWIIKSKAVIRYE